MNQTEMLKKLEWAGRLDNYSVCPDCGNRPSSGHDTDCELNRLINLPEIDCPMTPDEVRSMRQVLGYLPRFDESGGSQLKIFDEKINKLADWLEAGQINADAERAQQIVDAITDDCPMTSKELCRYALDFTPEDRMPLLRLADWIEQLQPSLPKEKP